MPDLQVITSPGATSAPSRRTAASLSISIVVYRPDLPLLRETCRSLGEALRVARRGGALSRAVVDLVDNGDEDPAALRAALA